MLTSSIYYLRQIFRKRRYRKLQELTKLESVNGLIMDLGGGHASFFSAFFPNPNQVILIDIQYRKALRARKNNLQLNVVVADAAHLPFSRDSIKMTICNSVIEHVDNPNALASEINRVSQGWFLQTPNGNFPLETHAIIPIPFYSLMPFDSLKRLLCKLFRGNFNYIKSVQYLSEGELISLFPKGVLSFERFLFFKKSFYISWPIEERS